VEQARQKGEDSASWVLAEIVAEAEQQATWIVGEAKRRSEDNATRIVAEAENKASQIMEEAKRKAESEAKTMMPEAWRTWRQVIEGVRGAAVEESSKIVSSEGVPDAQRTKGNEEEVVVIVHEEEEPPKQFDGVAELELVPPIHLGTLIAFHKHLKHSREIEVLNVSGSVDKGVAIKIFVRTPIPLLGLIRGLPIVKSVSNHTSLIPDEKGEGKKLLQKIIVTTH
jgi:vacuolar-type H+-ATPase subunit E/Vma4